MSSRRPVRPTQQQCTHIPYTNHTHTHTAGLAALKAFSRTPEAQTHKAFYDNKIASISTLQALLNGQATEDTKHDFFATSIALWHAIETFVLEKLPAALNNNNNNNNQHYDPDDDDVGDNDSNDGIKGPFIGGGARPGVDDFHVGAWLARMVSLLGAHTSKEGVDALEKRFGPLPENVKLYWAAWIARDSWVKAYPDNVLH
jgi:hypothetical protein